MSVGAGEPHLGGRHPHLVVEVHQASRHRERQEACGPATGARAKIEVYAAALGRLLPRTVPLAEALRVAASTDEACRTVWDGLTERRAANMRLFARDLRETGELRPDLTDDEVADLVWSMNSPQYYLLVTSRGATPERYAALVADVWVRTLLA